MDDAEFLQWLKNKPQDETYDGTDNYSCAIAQFLKETGRAQIPYVLSDSWYDEALMTKKGKPSVIHNIPSKSSRASVAIKPVNTFRHATVRLQLIIDKREMNDYYFEMK